MKHDIQQVTGGNFDCGIPKFRNSSVSSWWYFHDHNAEDIKLFQEYSEVPSEVKGGEVGEVCTVCRTE